MGEIITITTKREMVPLDEIGSLHVSCVEAAKFFNVNVSRIYKLTTRGHMRRTESGIPLHDLFTCNQDIARGSGRVPFLNHQNNNS